MDKVGKQIKSFFFFYFFFCEMEDSKLSTTRKSHRRLRSVEK